MCLRKLVTYFNKSVLVGVVLGAILVVLYNHLFDHIRTISKQDSAPQIISVPATATAKEEAYRVPQSAWRKLFSITECKTRPLQTSFKQRGDFWVLYNYVKADKLFRCYESITYTTQGDYRVLDNLLMLVERWRGPISVTLFAPGDDFQRTIDSIAYFRNCETPLIKDYVTFHVFFGTKHLPQVNASLSDFYKDTYNCSDGPPFAQANDFQSYRLANNVPYPINVARNVARESAQTHFVLSADIDLYPPKYFIKQFLSMVEKRTDLFRTQTRKVFVLPMFEILETANVPDNKTYLRKMLRDGTAILFSNAFCPQCHRAIDVGKWILAEETDGLDVFVAGKRNGLYKNWVPFYVGTHSDPLFDERLTIDDENNRMMQGYAMCLLNYDFMVLDNAFLIHKPGINRKTEVIYQKPKDETLRVFERELLTLLGKTDGCVL